MENITGITVVYNTKDLIERAFNSIRKFHPKMKIIIIDNSDKNNECYKYIDSLKYYYTEIIHTNSNIGHGRGLDIALKMVKTKYALIFDSDIEMLQSPLKAMEQLINIDSFGVGYTEIVGSDGFEYNVNNRNLNETPTKYLHPYFQLIQVSEYFKYPPYVHHGAPCYMTMNEIKRRGLSDKILIEFEGLGHSSGKGWNWTSEPRKYIRHDVAGTRKANLKAGLPEIVGVWTYPSK